MAYDLPMIRLLVGLACASSVASFASVSAAANPQPPVLVLVGAPRIARVGNIPCGEHGLSETDPAKCFQKEESGKLAVALSWNMCSEDNCTNTTPTGWALYRALPPQPSQGQSRRPATLAESGPPVATLTTPATQGFDVLRVLWIDTFKPGDCFVARAFIGPVASTSSYSPPSAPMCVTASTPVGAELVRYYMQSLSTEDIDVGCGKPLTIQPSPPYSVGAWVGITPSPSSTCAGAIRRHLAVMKATLPANSDPLHVSLVVPIGAQCATGVEVATPSWPKVPGQPWMNPGPVSSGLPVNDGSLNFSLDPLLGNWAVLHGNWGPAIGLQLNVDFPMVVVLTPPFVPAVTCLATIPAGPYLLVYQLRSPSL